MTRGEHFPHDADIGVRGIGTTVEGAFEAAALAMTAVITDPSNARAAETVQVSVSASDKELACAHINSPSGQRYLGAMWAAIRH